MIFSFSFGTHIRALTESTSNAGVVVEWVWKMFSISDPQVLELNNLNLEKFTHHDSPHPILRLDKFALNLSPIYLGEQVPTDVWLHNLFTREK